MATQDPKDVVRHGYDVISRTYRADDADAGNYAGWIARLREYLPDTGWTGAEEDWKGAPMWWSHADATTYREWLAEIGLRIEAEDFFREGGGGHPIFWALRPKPGPVLRRPAAHLTAQPEPAEPGVSLPDELVSPFVEEYSRAVHGPRFRTRDRRRQG